MQMRIFNIIFFHKMTFDLCDDLCFTNNVISLSQVFQIPENTKSDDAMRSSRYINEV